MKKIFLLLMFLCIAGRINADDFLPADKAFRINAHENTAHGIEVQYEVAKGYKLYKNKLSFELNGEALNSSSLIFPKSEKVFDENFNQNIEIYHHNFKLEIPVPSGLGRGELKIKYQGCADAGLCYPPAVQTINFDFANAVVEGNKSEAAVADSQDWLAYSALQDSDFLKIILLFFGFGLLLSMTPCVLPMIPILSSIILDQTNLDKRTGFSLSLSYSLGMATIYTALGLFAGLMGASFAVYIQKPWVLAIFSSLMVMLALSMFDVYQLQMPGFVQSKLSQTSTKLNRGKFFSTFLMGLLSGLIVGPCVAAPLAGALIYISQTKDTMLGGVALFTMAMGMSVPLLLIGLSAGSILPKAGSWMNGIKHLFGLMLLAVALWMLEPILTDSLRLFLWGVLAIFAGFMVRPFLHFNSGNFFHVLKLMIAVVLILFGTLEIIGASMGNNELLKPLKSSEARAVGVSLKAEAAASFKLIKSVDDLNRLIATSTKPVLVDFYADWCASCKELEKFTFADKGVQSKLSKFDLVRIDVTQGLEEDKELMKKFQVFGPPVILLFDSPKKMGIPSRLTGFVNSQEFLKFLER